MLPSDFCYKWAMVLVLDLEVMFVKIHIIGINYTVNLNVGYKYIG